MLLPLTWVCQKWRDAAIRSTTLWNIVCFKAMEFPFERSFAFLERAGTSPLDITIDGSRKLWYSVHMRDLDDTQEDGHPFTEDMMVNIMDMLLQKVQTIRTLVITANTWKPALVALDKLRECGNRPEQMERFELHRSPRPWLSSPGPLHQPPIRSNRISFCDGNRLPRLTYVCFNGVHIRWNVQQLSNLHVLDLRHLPIEICPSLSDFRAALQGSPRLSKLVFQSAGPKWPSDDVSHLPPVDLPNLVTLVLGGLLVQYAICLLDTITARNLIDLTVDHMVGFDYGPLIEHLTGRFPDIRVMTIRLLRSVPNKRQIINWLRSMPNTEILKIADLEKSFVDCFLEDANAGGDGEYHRPGETLRSPPSETRDHGIRQHAVRPRVISRGGEEKSRSSAEEDIRQFALVSSDQYVR